MHDDSLQADFDALNRFILDYSELEQLEALLGGFNLFQVLKFEYGEIHHSNVLAWLLDPSESHGLGQTFLQRLLVRILHESDKTRDITPVDIHCWQPHSFEVRREWNHIDLLCIITFADRTRWVVCIENKIKAQQRFNQLFDYRQVVERHFPDVKRRLYILLSKNRETPADDEYHIADYGQVHRTLRDCLASRENVIGTEPRVLIENYLRLLEEKFMNQSQIASTARQIYQRHKRALDIIFANRPDSVGEITAELINRIVSHGPEWGILPVPRGGATADFIPASWDHPGNTHGKEATGTNRSLVFQIEVSMGQVSLVVASWQNPDPWTQRIWAIASNDPFTGPPKADAPNSPWCRLHLVGLGLKPSEMEPDPPEEIAARIFAKAMEEYASPRTQQVVRILEAELPALDEAFRAQGR
jgi:hypothetical protein